MATPQHGPFLGKQMATPQHGPGDVRTLALAAVFYGHTDKGSQQAHHADLRGRRAGAARLGQVGHPGVPLGGAHPDGALQVFGGGRPPRDAPLPLALLLRGRLRCHLPQLRLLARNIQRLAPPRILHRCVAASVLRQCLGTSLHYCSQQGQIIMPDFACIWIHSCSGHPGRLEVLGRIFLIMLLQVAVSLAQC